MNALVNRFIDLIVPAVVAALLSTGAVFAAMSPGLHRIEDAASDARTAAVEAKNASVESNQNEALVRELSQVTKSLEQVILAQQAEADQRAAQLARQGPLFTAYMKCLFTAGERAQGYTPEFEQSLIDCDRQLLNGAAQPRPAS